MATVLQAVPNDPAMTLVNGNVSSMAPFPQTLYTEFTLSESRYPTQKINGFPHNTSNSAFQQSFTNSSYWNGSAAVLTDAEAPAAKEASNEPQLSQLAPERRTTQQISLMSVPQDPGIDVDTPYADLGGEPSSVRDPSTPGPMQAQQSGTRRSPVAASSSRDFTTPRQPTNLANYHPQNHINGYLSHQTLPSTSQIPIPVSINPRAYAQHPTYINPPANSATPVYMKPQTQKEEVCLECAMRDQDMADVDVTSPGVWERESDVFYKELLQMEEDAPLGTIPPPHDPLRASATGDLLTETNLKIHMSMNPREPASRHRNLEIYVKAQRLLLEAETLAHARAVQESLQLDTKMRDTYTQLRRSVYDVGGFPEDANGVKIRAPRSISTPPSSPIVTIQNQAREVTLLENGMIMEHVNVKREEREERERRRREEKRERNRARKLSRSSGADVNSIYSTLTPVPADSGFTLGMKPSSRYSQSSLRPGSILSASGDRSSIIPRAYSTASFSDFHSITSASSPNRRTRFFGLKNLSAGWRSRDSLAPSGISGSMMDMHVALQQEQNENSVNPYPYQYPPVDIGSNAPTLHMGESWPQTNEKQLNVDGSPDPSGVKPPKAKTGFARIWGIVTGSSKSDTRARKGPPPVLVKSEDDFPLAPPPPLSYLVDRDRGSSSRRHVSTPSLPSTTLAYPASMSSQNLSPPTAPSSILPSPTSSRVDAIESRVNGIYDLDHDQQITDEVLKSKTMPNLSPTSSSRPHTMVLVREKSLPPLPVESSVRFPSDGRPQTMFAVDSRQDCDLVPPRPPFGSESRRQSFGGLELRPHPRSATYNGSPQPVGAIYGEFGSSRLSLGWWEDPLRGQRHGVGSVETTGSLKTAAKRRSKFGLSSLFGKKNKEDIVTSADHESVLYSMRSSEHEARGFGISETKMSLSSQKAIHELVEQDPEFVAYRYPSNDQPLGMFQ